MFLLSPPQDVQVMNFSLAPPDGGPELIKNADLLLGTIARVFV